MMKLLYISGLTVILPLLYLYIASTQHPPIFYQTSTNLDYYNSALGELTTCCWNKKRVIFPRWEHHIPTLGINCSHVGNK